MYSNEYLDWYDVEPFFRDNGCVMEGHPELRWFQESWGVLIRNDDLGDPEFGESEVGDVLPKLKAICLLAMYLGIYQAAGEYSELGGFSSGPSSLNEYLGELDINSSNLWELARREGLIETEARSYYEDEETDDRELEDVACDLVEGENLAIFNVLANHYGGKTGLYVSIWNSRFELHEIEPVEIACGPDDCFPEKLQVFEYVDEGMASWWWNE